jgi:hypothetical protein
VASFYDMFQLEPVGRYVLGICTNIACMLEGAEELLHHAEERLGVKHGATTPDGLFTIEEVECVAHCNFAPCLQANYRYFGPLSNESFDQLVDDLGAGRLKDEVPPHGTLIRVRRSCGLQVPPEQIVEERRIVAGQIADRAAGEAATKQAAEERDAKAKAEAERVEKEASEQVVPGRVQAEELGEAKESQDAEGEAKVATPAATTDVEGKTGEGQGKKNTRRRKKT